MFRTRCVFVAISMLVSAVAVIGADVSGTWVGTLSPPGGGSENFLLILTQDGTKVTGTAGANESDRHALEKGAVQGDRLTFEVQAPNGTLVFDLKVNADEINGTLTFKNGEQVLGTARVSVKRSQSHG